MIAVLVEGFGGPERLVLGRAPEPGAGPGEVVIRIAATAVNRADLLQREGRYPPPAGASDILGLEAAGIVETVGQGTRRLAVGDRVFALLSGGGYAERVTVPEAHCMRIPPGMSFVEAAALAEAFLTAWQSLTRLAAPAAGDAVLIHAGASGVGTAALQIARELGLRPFATCSSSKTDACLALGAERAIDYRAGSFADVVLEATGGRGASCVVDPVGAPYLADDLRCLAMDGTIVLLATMGGARVDGFDLRAMMRKRATLRASTLRSRDAGYKSSLVTGFEDFAMPRLSDGRLRPVIHAVFPWSRAADAHRLLESGATVGKIVLVVDAGLAQAPVPA